MLARRTLVHPGWCVVVLAVLAMLTTPAAAQSQRDIDLLKRLGIQERQSPVTPQPIDAGPPLNPRQQVHHVLNRLAFGSRPGQVDQLTNTNWQSWARIQLQPESIDDREVEKIIAERYPSMTMTMAHIFEKYRPPFKNNPPTPGDQQERNRLRYVCRSELTQAVLIRAAGSKRQLFEVILQFWRNHFNVDQNKESCNYLANHYEKTLRRHVFGRFEDLLLSTAKHPAMLIYLDNALSRRGLTPSEKKQLDRADAAGRSSRTIDKLRQQRGLNENYAREVMELHTLGVDSYYKESDVYDLARVLTGWSVGVQDDKYGFQFYPHRHDPYPKTVVGMRVRSGGVEEGEAVIRHLARHPGTAWFISWKLCRYLVNDNPPEQLVKRIARQFVKTRGDLRKVYEAIIFSPEFMQRTNYRAKFKTPFEFTVSALRAVDADITDPRPTLASLKLMGQPVYECEDPTGYYDQAEAWLDPGVLVHRWDYALRLAGGQMGGVTLPKSLHEQYLNLPADEAKKKLIEAIFPGGVDDRTRAALDNVANTQRVLGLLLGSPTFQQQ